MIRIEVLKSKEGCPGLVFDAIARLHTGDGQARVLGCFRFGDKCSELIKVTPGHMASTASREAFVTQSFTKEGWALDHVRQIDFTNLNLFDLKVPAIAGEDSQAYDGVVQAYHLDLLKETLKECEIGEEFKGCSAPYQAMLLLQEYRERALQAQGEFACLRERIEAKTAEIEQLQGKLAFAKVANEELETQLDASRTGLKGEDWATIEAEPRLEAPIAAEKPRKKAKAQ